MYIDTHTHLYSRKFAEDRAEMMDRVRAAGVALALLPAVDRSSHAAMLQLEQDYATQTLAMIGLHPVSVKEDVDEELAVVKAYLDQRPWVAIGEIGMDLYWDKSFRKQQEAAFLTQCQWALDYDLPICIHAREAIDELLELITTVGDDRLRGVFHCFTGNLAQARRAIDLGFYLGIGGVVTFKNGGLEPVLREMPRERILLETDAPYLAPVPYRGKRNETAYLPLVAEKIAELWETSPAAVGRQTCYNAWQLFELDHFVQADYPWAALGPPVRESLM
ncbi:TatD family hydrolase [Neolewinella lacunae]|uniref:TatD family hydrolase n=1 Tax=Neolewinella lacunae TaxID=1517758 RepID=A0A923PHD5_9BACT|nr:TatD family hydrolase [Neolewinella lacunae]MBC6992751.1 TatD family hydrolase [Neolewinella lacunae]MDN3635995.1 TatD family hydrolase [Neolewinella lacunae]